MGKHRHAKEPSRRVSHKKVKKAQVIKELKKGRGERKESEESDIFHAHANEEERDKAKTDWKQKLNLQDVIPQYQKESILHVEETIPPGDRPFANRLHQALSPYTYFFLPSFRIPLWSKRNLDGSYHFKTQLTTVRGVGFSVTAIIFIITTLIVFGNMLGLLLNVPEQRGHIFTVNSSYSYYKSATTLHNEQLYLFQRNFASLIIVLCSLIHLIMGDINFFHRRSLAAEYFLFFSESVELLKIDAGKGVRRFMIRCFLFYAIFLIIFALMCAVRFAPMATGGPALFALLLLRIPWDNVHEDKYFFIIRTITAVYIFYIIFSAKVYVFLMLYKSRILTNAYKVWNDRLERVLHKGEGGKTREVKNATRTGYDHLFKDHVILLDLVDGTDTLFANTIESYYVTQVVSICAEIYYWYKSYSDEHDFKGARSLDTLFISCYTFHTLATFFLITTAACEVGEEAMNGLDVIRRKGLIGRKSEEEIFFMLSMYMSYAGHFTTAITGGGYYLIDKAFLVGIIASIFSYFIIVIQFTPPLSMKDEHKLENITNIMLLIKQAEGTVQISDKYPVGYLRGSPLYVEYDLNNEFWTEYF